MSNIQNTYTSQPKAQNDRRFMLKTKLAIGFALFAASVCLFTAKVPICNKTVSQNIAFILCILGAIAISFGFDLITKRESKDIIIAAICFFVFIFPKPLRSLYYNITSCLFWVIISVLLGVILIVIYLVILKYFFSQRCIVFIYISNLVFYLNDNNDTKALPFIFLIEWIRRNIESVIGKLIFIKEAIERNKEFVTETSIECSQLIILIIGLFFLFSEIINVAERAFHQFSSALKKTSTSEDTIANFEKLIALLGSIATLIFTVLQAIYINMGDHQL